MNIFLESFVFSLSVTLPIFLILLLGIYLKRINFINDEFIHISSRIVYNFALPLLLFFTIVKTPLSEVSNLPLIVFGLSATLIAYLILEWWAKRFEPKQDRGVFVQGAFRGNLGFIGLAYCVNAYGEEGLIAASLYIGLLTTLYNVLGIVTLNRSMSKTLSVVMICKNTLKNPLIIGILAAFVFSGLNIPIPVFAETTGGYMANLTIPLALLCTGGALNFQELKTNPNKTLYASAIKLIVMPFLITLGGYVYGFKGMDLGILFLMTAAPTATVSFILVKGIGGNYKLAANIIAMTALGSLISVSLGVLVLRSLALM